VEYILCRHDESSAKIVMTGSRFVILGSLKYVTQNKSNVATKIREENPSVYKTTILAVSP